MINSVHSNLPLRWSSSVIAAACLLFVMLSKGDHALAVDPPHNGQNSQNMTIACSACHYDTTGPTPSWATQPTTTDETFYNNLCTSCHQPTAITDSRYIVKTHSYQNTSGKYGVWTVECRTCHNPHNQDQISSYPTDTTANLATGTVTVTPTQLPVASTTQSTIAVSGPLTPNAWIDHILIPNIAYPTRMYHIRSNTDSTITVSGAINARYAAAGSTYAIRTGTMVIGQLVTPGGLHATVKFFTNDPSQLNSYASSTDPANVTGICQVCHTQTKSFNRTNVTGSIQEGPNHPRVITSGQICTTCHIHTEGLYMDCASCHGMPPLVAAQNGGGVSNGMVNNDGGTGSSTPGSHGKHAVTLNYSCSTCHAGGMPASAIYDKRIQIGFYIAGGTYQGGSYDGRSALANGFSYGAGNAGTSVTQNGTMTCIAVYCHSDGTSIATGTVPAIASPNWGTGTTACASCHGYPPSYASGSPKPNSHGQHNFTCDNCHYATTTNGTVVTNPTVHVNNVYDLQPGPGRTFSYSFAQPNGTCSTVSCHGDTGTQWGASACLNCHTVAQGSRAAIAPQFGGNSHHVQGISVTGSHCYRCHWEANSDGSINPAYHGGSAAPGSPVNLVIYQAGTRPVSYAPGSTAVQYTADGSRTQVANITPHCIGCHSDQNNTTQPFGDGKTPRQYAWDNTSVAARYSQTGTTTWGKYTGANITPKNTLTKAFSAHGNAVANQGGWDLNESWPNTRNGSVNIACFDCHNSHGSNAQGTTTNYVSATLNGGILKNTVATQGGYAGDYVPVSGGSTSDRNAYNAGAGLCLDCHLNASGGSSQPWGYQTTFNSLQPVMGYWDTPYFGPGTFGSQQRFPYKMTGHQGGHFGASTGLSSTPTSTMKGLCTPCHDPHGVSPTIGSCSLSGYYTAATCVTNGGTWSPSPQYAVPLLKGTFLTSPYKEDTAPSNIGPFLALTGGRFFNIDQDTFSSGSITETDSQFAGLCITCHSKASLSNGTTHTWRSKDRVHESVKGWKTANGTIQHQYPCSKCHTPHNSQLPRLMVTNCLDPNHKGRTGHNTAPVLSAGGSGYAQSDMENCSGSAWGCYNDGSTYGSGSGSGRFPGAFNSSGSHAPGTNNLTCHEGNTGSGTDQGWNIRTPWFDDSIFISTSPTAGSFQNAGANIQATITWTTDNLSDSCVDYGLTTAYGSTVCDATPVTYHAITITMPGSENHALHHYRVRSLSATSPDSTFTISVAPTVPGYVYNANPYLACAASCSAPFTWGASTDPDNGAVEYQVEVDTATSFTTANRQISPWISAPTTTWSPVLATNNTWYFRTRARDANHTEAVSAWTGYYSFSYTMYRMSNVITSGPTATNFRSSGTSVEATVNWSTEILSYSSVDSGPTVSYTSTTGYDSLLVYNHSRTIQNLTNHVTNHYRVAFRDPRGNEVLSGDNTFMVSAPPNIPTLTNLPASICASACSVTLQYSTTDPDNGPIEYAVEVDDDPAFGSVNTSSGWIASTSWSPLLATNTGWNWRVRARDANHTTPQDLPSAWSAVGRFTLSDGSPPTQVVLTYPANGSTVPSDVAMQWNAVNPPFTEYEVQYSTSLAFDTGVVSSGWIAGTAWAPAPGPGIYYWRVQARNTASQATGPVSLVWSFAVTDGCYGDSCCLYGCSTCPTLYAWDGTTFVFETDTFPTGFLGTRTATGWRKPNPYEYHLLESTPQLLDGYYNLKIVEERDETDYFDALKLYTVDYPLDRDIYQELRTAGIYVPPAQMIHTVDKILKRPVSITHVNTGDNVSATLADSDEDYLILNTDRNIDFNWHTLEVDLGAQSSAPQIKLIIDAEMVVPTTSAGMARKLLLSPTGKITRLEVLDANGNWTLVPSSVKEIFSPKERSTAYIVDITNIFVTPIYKFRLSFLYKVYVDAIFFDTTLDVPVTVTELPLVSATLGYYGFSEMTEGEIFDYIYGSIVSRDISYFTGNYTRYGDVTPLLAQTDDKFVIFAGGEELDVRFSADSQPPVGKARRYLVYANGYYKATGNVDIPHTVEPLPFNAMSNYPYNPAVENYPADADHNQYRADYNTRAY